MIGLVTLGGPIIYYSSWGLDIENIMGLLRAVDPAHENADARIKVKVEIYPYKLDRWKSALYRD